MKKLFLNIIVCIVFFGLPVVGQTTENKIITINTDRSSLVLMARSEGSLFQVSYGAIPESNTSERNATTSNRPPSREREFYPASGNGSITEPALQVTHADGNTSTELFYTGHETKAVDGNTELTVIHLKDPQFPFYTDIYIKAFKKEDVLEMWTEIYHEEPSDVILYRYASASPLIRGNNYWLTQFHGNYKYEATLT